MTPNRCLLAFAAHTFSTAFLLAATEPSTSNINSFIGNRGVEPDDRGRIPMWGEEKDDTLMKGSRAGGFRPDTEIKREGKASVLVTSSNDWFGFASVNYPLPPWTDSYELSGWARTTGSSSAQLLACWTDDSQKVLRVNAGETVTSEEWKRISLNPASPPTTATNQSPHTCPR